MIYLTSDPHFLHAKITRYCGRPEKWADLYVKNWQRIVKPNDTVIVLGDIGLGAFEALKEIVSSLPGRKIAIKGNHDQSWPWLERLGFDTPARTHGEIFIVADDEIGAYEFVLAEKDEDPRTWSQQIAVSHAPRLNVEWPYFYGHIHNNPIPFSNDYMPFDLTKVKGRNLCVEVTNYLPVPLPALTHAKDWLDAHWKDWFVGFFGLEAEKTD